MLGWMGEVFTKREKKTQEVKLKPN